MIRNNKIIGNVRSNSLVGRVLNKVLGLDFVWDGTKLGVKKENQDEYIYSDLVGPQGTAGLNGQDGQDGHDGVGLLFNWNGTDLGIKRENESNYSYQNLKGQDGQNGQTPIKGVDYFTSQDKAEIQTPISDQYNPNYTYAVGDYCIYNNTLYRCTTAISTAETWTSAHWIAVNISDELVTITNELSNKLNSNKVIQENEVASIGKVYSSKAVENLMNGTTLYESVIGSNSNITLSETLANYSYIEVFYRNNDNYYYSIKVDNPNGKNVVLTGITASLYANKPNFVIKTQTREVSGSSLIVTNYQEISVYDGVISAHNSDNNIYITKVIGYK